MSLALMIVGLIAIVLAIGLLVSFWWVVRVESRHEAATGILTSERPTRAGSSGDLHLFLGLPADVVPRFEAATAELATKGGVPPEKIEPLAAAFESLFVEASHAYADFGHFRPIRVRTVPGVAAIVYLNVRARRPIATLVDRGSRAEWRTILGGLRALTPAEAIEISWVQAVPSDDPADGKLVALVDAAVASGGAVANTTHKSAP
jgi:hypothetical protein